MSLDRADVDTLLEIVTDFADRHLTGGGDVDLSGPASETPLLSLAADLASEGGSEVLAWVAEVVEAVSERSAAWGFTLASRYTAQLAVHDAPADAFVASGVIEGQAVTLPSAPVAAGNLGHVLALTDAGLHLVTGASPLAEQPIRTGLAGARLIAVAGVIDEVPPATAQPADVVHAVLLGAVATGLSRSLLREAVQYTEVREQFGAPISTFAGLRAVVGSAHRAATFASLALGAVAGSLDADAAVTASADAADQALNNAIDAVQALGGYGYIDEYPVAAKLRDAISLRARVAPAHEAWRASARAAYDADFVSAP